MYMTPPAQDVPTPEAQIAPILKQHEDSLTGQIPSFLKEAMPEPPSTIFSDYTKTGDPSLKQKAGRALDNLSMFVDGVKNAAATGINTILGKTVYNAPPHMDILKVVLGHENESGDPHAIRHNSDGTKDYGLYQINSSNIPFLRDEFKKLNRTFNVFNPDDSKLGATMLLRDNAKRFRDATGRAPTDMELASSYHVGVTNLIKQAKENIQGKRADRYMKASIYHPPVVN